MSTAEASPSFTVKDIGDSSLVVTGGSSGIGFATAASFLAAGAPRVLIIGRNHERGHAALARLRALGGPGDVEFLSADCNDPAVAEDAIAHAEEFTGGIDVLVNATAATFVPELLHRIPVADLPQILAQQALAPLLMTRVVLPLMAARRGGVIINIASDAAKVPTPGESMIGAAMAAIVSFTRTAAMEGKRAGVRVNALTPSLVSGTATTERILTDGFSAKLFTKVGTMAHLGIATPEDQADLILYLASPAAARLTGQAISLNGGVSAA
jgi:NAD(P)-dependent dehydrogenase (short-subunit alcohol dehydrogenase family)